MIEKRPRDEATGEVVSLAGKIGSTKMGDKYQRSKPSAIKEEEERKRRKKAKAAASDFTSSSFAGLGARSNLLTDDFEEMGIFYTPKTPETRQTYEALLKFIHDILGDQPRDVLCGAADEVLASLKNEKMTEKQKQKDIQSLLGGLSSEQFNILFNLSRKITDYKLDDKPDIPIDENMDETYGVNVQFEENDDDEESDIMRVVDDDDDEDGEGEETGEGSTLQANYLEASSGRKSSAPTSKPAETLHPRQIDAYWLQRNLNKTYGDPVEAKNKAAEVMDILKTASDDRDAENKLVMLLGFKQFDFIKLLRQNRQMILYCTLLASAQSADEKNKLRQRMSSDPELLPYLTMLESTDEKSDLGAKERTGKRAAKEKESDMEPDEENLAQLSKVEMLDLEDLVFAQGSHFMANKRCQLPEGSFRRARKGYEEIHVPALKPKPFDDNEVSTF